MASFPLVGSPEEGRVRRALGVVRGASWRSRAVTLAPLLLLAGVCWVGVAWRWEQGAGGLHHPRHHVRSDAFSIVRLAFTLLDQPTRQGMLDTVWPPGAAALIGATAAVDPSLSGAARLWFALSLFTPLMVAVAAGLAWGRRAAAVALAAGALHFGYVHYAGFFLSEQPFQAAAALAVAVTVLALTRPHLRFWPAFFAGAAWALASAFRPNALPAVALVVVALAVRWALQRRAGAWRWCLGLGLGLALAVAPLAHRCTTLMGGRPCLVSSNAAVNVVLGHAGEVSGVRFVPRDPALGGTHGWSPPALLQHGYKNVGEVPLSMFDAPALYGWVWDRARADPLEFARVSLGNALDLFRTDLWPTDYAPWRRRSVHMAGTLFLLAVVAPALVMLVRTLALVRRRGAGVELPHRGDVHVLLVTLVVGVLLTSAASLGEPRYRIPFDVAFILLAVAWVGPSSPARDEASAEGGPASPTSAPAPPQPPEAPEAGPGRWVRVAGFCAGVLLLAVTLGLGAVAHPRLGVLQRWSAPAAPYGRSLAFWRTVRLQELPRSAKDGAPWNSSGTVVIPCAVGCAALRVTLGKPSQATAVSVAVDRRDRYEITLLRGEERLSRHAIGLSTSGTGLSSYRVVVPASVRAGGFDAIAVRPVAGDGSYSVAAVSLEK